MISSFSKYFISRIITFSVVLLLSVPLCSATADVPSTSASTPDSLIQLASQFYNEGNYREAIALVSKIDSTVSSPVLMFYVGMSYAAINDYRHARAFLNSAIDHDSTNVNYRFQFARFLVQASFTDDAIDQLKICISRDSTFLPAYFQLGVIFNIQKKSPQKELELFSFLTRQNIADFLSWYYLGDAQRRLGLVDSALVTTAHSVSLNPRFFPSVIALANLRNSKKDYAIALNYYQQADTIRPNDKDIIFQIGECYRKLGNLDKAIEHYNRAIRLDSLNAIYHAQLAHTYFLQERYKLAITVYNKAISIDSEKTQYYLNLALAYKKVDSTQGVIQSYLKAIKSQRPEDISDLWVELGTFYSEKRMLRDSEKAYKRALDVEPKNALALVQLGFTYEGLHDDQAVIHTFEKYLSLTEGDSSKSAMREMAKATIKYLKKK